MPSRDWIKNNPEKYLVWKKSLTNARVKFAKDNPGFQSGNKNHQYGKSPWNKGLTKEKDDRVKRYTETKNQRISVGIIVPFWKGKKHSTIHKFRNAEAKKGEKNPMKIEATRKKVSENLRQKWKGDEIFVSRMLKSFKNLKYNNFEREFENCCNKENLPFIYVGNGSFWIGPCISGKRRNPDFKHAIEKKVILLNGDHWHTKEESLKQIKDYEEKGYSVLSIWESEWKKSKEEMISRVKTFSNYSGQPVN